MDVKSRLEEYPKLFQGLSQFCFSYTPSYSLFILIPWATFPI